MPLTNNANVSTYKYHKIFHCYFPGSYSASCQILRPLHSHISPFRLAARGSDIDGISYASMGHASKARLSPTHIYHKLGSTPLHHDSPEEADSWLGCHTKHT